MFRSTEGSSEVILKDHLKRCVAVNKLSNSTVFRNFKEVQVPKQKLDINMVVLLFTPLVEFSEINNIFHLFNPCTPQKKEVVQSSEEVCWRQYPELTACDIYLRNILYRPPILNLRLMAEHIERVLFRMDASILNFTPCNFYPIGVLDVVTVYLLEQPVLKDKGFDITCNGRFIIANVVSEMCSELYELYLMVVGEKLSFFYIFCTEIVGIPISNDEVEGDPIWDELVKLINTSISDSSQRDKIKVVTVFCQIFIYLVQQVIKFKIQVTSGSSLLSLFDLFPNQSIYDDSIEEKEKEIKTIIEQPLYFLLTRMMA